VSLFAGYLQQAMAADFEIGFGIHSLYPFENRIYNGNRGLPIPIFKERLVFDNGLVVQLSQQYFAFGSGSATAGTGVSSSGETFSVMSVSEGYVRTMFPVLLSVLYTFPQYSRFYIGGGAGLYWIETRLQEQRGGTERVWSDQETVLGGHGSFGFIPFKNARWFVIETGAEWFRVKEVRQGYDDGGNGGGFYLEGRFQF
jgi:hypothetical protein